MTEYGEKILQNKSNKPIMFNPMQARLKLGQAFNSRYRCTCSKHFLSSAVKRPSLQLKNQPKYVYNVFQTL